MDSLNDDKINRHSSDLEVESEEKQSGKEIEVDEDRLPSRAMAIHEHIRQDGEKEMERDAMALLWSNQRYSRDFPVKSRRERLQAARGKFLSPGVMPP